MKDGLKFLQSKVAAAVAVAVAMAMKSRGAFVIISILFGLVTQCQSQDVQILSKSQIEDCSRTGLEDLNCTSKLVLEIAVPSGTKGSSNKIEVPVDKARSVSSGRMQIFKDAYKISIEKSSTNAIFRLSYVMDANFRPRELAFSLNKCNPANDYRMGMCARMRDRYNNPIEGTEAICCRCGINFRYPFCGKKRRSAHCLRYNRVWYRTFSVQESTLHFYIKIIVFTEEKELSVIYLAPSIPQGVTYDKFLKASIQGDYLNYQGIQKMENFYLSAPKNSGGNGLDYNYTKWMLLERTRYTFGDECDKIGIGPKGFRRQIGFCTSTRDQSAMMRNQLPQYVIARRFERINKAWPKPQDGQLSLGITEELITNILLEIRADDIRFIVNVSSGNITSFHISTVEALSKPATAIVTIRNTGDLVASYYVSVECTKGVNPLLENSLSIEPNKTTSTIFEITVNQVIAIKHNCTVTLKDAEFKYLDKRTAWFSVTATEFDKGKQTGFNETPIENMISSGGGNGIESFFSKVGKSLLNFGRKIMHKFGHGIASFFNGKNCKNCSFFNLKCQFTNICIQNMLKLGWIIVIILAGLFAICILCRLEMIPSILSTMLKIIQLLLKIFMKTMKGVATALKGCMVLGFMVLKSDKFKQGCMILKNKISCGLRKIRKKKVKGVKEKRGVDSRGRKGVSRGKKKRLKIKTISLEKKKGKELETRQKKHRERKPREGRQKHSQVEQSDVSLMETNLEKKHDKKKNKEEKKMYKIGKGKGKGK